MPKITRPLGEFEQELSLTGAEPIKADTEVIQFDLLDVTSDISRTVQYDFKIADERMQDAEVLRVGYLMMANGSVTTTFVEGGVYMFRNFESILAQTGTVLGWERSDDDIAGPTYSDYAAWDCGNGIDVALTATHPRANVHFDFTNPADRAIVNAEDFLKHVMDITTSGAGTGTWVKIRPYVIIKRKAI